MGQLVEQLEQRGDRLPFEIGAFVALEACEGLLKESVKLEADDVRVTPEGSVVVAGSAPPAEPDEAARSLVSVLARLLVAAGPGVPPHLLQLIKETTTGQSSHDLRRLHDAIEASLIPINRSASRRVLARLVRESDRPPGPEAPPIDPRELDAELDELLGDPGSRTLETAQEKLPLPEEPEEPVTERIRIPRPAARDVHASAADEPRRQTHPALASEPAMKRASVPLADPPERPVPAAAVAAVPISEERRRPASEPVTATIRKWQPDADTRAASEPAPVSVSAMVPVSAAVPVATVGAASEMGLETATEAVFGTGSVTRAEPVVANEPLPAPMYDRASLPQQQRRRHRGGWGIWLLAAALGLGIYALIATRTLDAWVRPAAPEPPPSGVIDVTVSPPGAQIFAFVGRGPVVVQDMPVGSAHEFVVFDRGLRPSRAVVPEGASWTMTDKGPMYELAVQAQAAAAPVDALDLGGPQTQTASSGTGSTGTIRVITNPPGAKVFRFVGVGPTARIPAGSIHEGQEILIYHPDHETRRAVIGPSDWQSAEGQSSYIASLEVDLPALPQSAVSETVEN
jgi:hypothetical protein